MAFRVLVIDTETAGLPLSRSKEPSASDNWPRIVQVGAILYKCPYNGKPGRVLQKYNALVKPDGWSISEGSMKVHGITNEYARDNGRDIKEILNELTDLVKKVNAICCHNVPFDIPVILSEYLRNDFIKIANESPYGYLPTICTMTIGKKLCRILTEATRKNGDTYMYYKSPRLSEMYKHMYGEDFKGKLHDALDDCEATVAILDGLMRDHVPFLRIASPELFRFTSLCSS